MTDADELIQDFMRNRPEPRDFPGRPQDYSAANAAYHEKLIAICQRFNIGTRSIPNGCMVDSDGAVYRLRRKGD